MKSFARTAIFALAFACMAPVVATPPNGAIDPSASDPTTGVLPAPNDVYANWKNAGLVKIGGRPARATQCGATVNPSGRIPPVGGDDASRINAAIGACKAGQVVQLGAGATHAITASISGNTLTLTSGTGLAVGQVLIDGVGGKLMPGTTITAGSGDTWTISFPPVAGGKVANEAMTAIVPFNIAQSETINLNKGITLRGSGSYTGAFWPSIINVYDGLIPDWSISATSNGRFCGVTSAKIADCTAGAAVILVSPSGNYAWGWGGCTVGQPINPTTKNCGSQLAADVAQGATVVQVAATKNFSVGMWVLIDESPALTSVANPTGTSMSATIQASSDFLSPSPSPATNRVGNPDAGEGGTTLAWSLFPNRVNAELHLITAIGTGPCPGTGCTLTFDDPLSIAFRQSGNHDARVYWPQTDSGAPNPFLAKAGVENLAVYRAPDSAVNMLFTANSWVRNFECGGWAQGCVNTNWSARSLVEHNYFHHCYDCQNNGDEYPFGISAASTEVLADDNIIILGGKGMVGRAACCSVVAYNYVDQTFYQQASIGNWFLDMSVNGSHYAGTHHWLFEGNWGNNCDSDETHGNAVYHTFFRNQCTGNRTTFIDPSNPSLTVNDAAGQGFCGAISCGAGKAQTPGPRRAAGPMAFDYWFAFVGNALGLSGVTTSANHWIYKCSTQNGGNCIWMTGWTGGEWNSQPDANLNGTHGTYIFRHGNYDYVTASISDWTAGLSHALPSSFYLTSAPPVFSSGTCMYPWPWVDSQKAPFVLANSCGGSGLPAKARWTAGNPFAQP